MAQCRATAKTPGRPNFGKQCGRSAVTGSTLCERHGGMEDSTSPESIRQKIDRPRLICHATKNNGEPCRAYAIHGAKVCRRHGGSLPSVKKAARERMRELVDPAIAELGRIIEKSTTSDADRLRAITLVLDRTGFGPKTDVTVGVKAYEGVIDRIFKQLPPGVETVEPEPVAKEPLALEAGPSWTRLPVRQSPEVVRRDQPKVGSRNPPAHLR
jgi:hypothetical protein